MTEEVRIAIEGAGLITEWYVPVNGIMQRKELKEFIEAGIQAYRDSLDEKS